MADAKQPWTITEWIQKPGTMLILGSVVHEAVGVIDARLGPPMLAALRGGFGSADDVARACALFFHALGAAGLSMGVLMNDYERTTGMVTPAYVGGMLTVAGAVSAYVMPKSGFWGQIALGLYIVYRSFQEDRDEDEKLSDAIQTRGSTVTSLA